MRHWENHTCISFVERTPEDYNYIVFTERPCGCCSFVGKRGNGPQAISIGKNCDKFGIVVHELGHVIGFWHEHTRPDRGEYVQILYDNIMPGQENNFYTVAPNEVDSLGEPYDFQSIMHYARNTFSKATELDSIVPRPELLPSGGGFVRHDIGQRVKLSDGDVAQANKLYRCPKCGRTLQDSQGVFGSPVTTNGGGGDGGSWPPQTGRSELCQWRIQATHGEKIVLNVTMLDLPDSVDCTNSYLEVRDGPSITSPLIGRFCGSAHLPGTMMSSDSRMWIEYRLSHVGRYRGFAAKYEAVCGGEVQRENGILSSPNYPEYYKPSKECVWKIKVPDGYTAALKFQSFEVENHDTCVYDYVEVRDGSDPGSPLLGKFCGYRIPQDVRSSSNLLYVKFVSDGSVQKEGFAATFVKEHDECQSEDHGCEHICINTVGGYRCECKIGFELNQDGRTCEDACGGYLDGANGTFMSPFFPSVYPPNKNCVWMIVAPPQHRITITFTHFDVEGNNQDCEYDSVEIRSGLDQNSRIHGTYCGSHLPQPVTSESNRLRVSFTTDNTVQKSGFSAYFFTDKDECATNNGGCQHVCKNTIGSYECSCLNGFTLHDNKHDCKEGGCQHEVTTVSGDVTSPNWPENYPSRKECVWHFTATPGHRIKLVFSEFELEAHLECTYDSVAVYDGEDSSTRLIGRYCGNARPPPAGIISRSNRLYMKFTSDASVQRRGFFASHSTVCGGMLTATDHVGEFYSHAKYGDHNYDNRADCDWMIVAENQHQRVRLRFQTLEIEVENECGYDYVEVYDGSSPEATQLGRFCGNELPPEFLSSGPMLFVRFKTDDTIFGKGFAAIYMQASYDGLIPPTGGSLSGVPSLIPYEPKSRKGKTVPSKKQHQQHLRTVTKTVT
jgi:tolkin protein